MKKAIFLDRDGTVIIDQGYLKDPERVVIYPGVIEPLCEFRKAGYLLVIISNQSGIGRGMYSLSDVEKVNEKMVALFKSEGIEFDDILICPHSPEENCECRKPEPKLLIECAEKLDIDLSNSAIIGDKKSDAECGISAGCKFNIFLDNGKQPVPEDEKILVVKNLKEAFCLIKEGRSDAVTQ